MCVFHPMWDFHFFQFTQHQFYPTWEFVFSLFNSISTHVPTIPHLNLKNGFRSNVKNVSIRFASKQRCRLQLEPLHSGRYSDLTRVAYSIELYLRHRIHTQTFSQVYSKSPCVLRPCTCIPVLTNALGILPRNSIGSA